jgi:hypothetical protein
MLNIYFDVLAAYDRAFAHTSRDNCRMTRHAAARGENGTSSDDSVKVFRGRFVANENDRISSRCSLDGAIGIEHGDTACCTWTCRKAKAKRLGPDGRIDDRMQQLIEIGRGNSLDSFGSVNQTLQDHVARNPHCGRCGTLSGTGLEKK